MVNNIFSEEERMLIKNKIFINKRGEEKNYTYISQLLSKNGFFATYVFGNMIKLSSFNSKEKFIKNYFKSGSKRKKIIKEKSLDWDMYTDYDNLIKYKEFLGHKRNLLNDYGRTMQEINKIAKLAINFLKYKAGLELNDEDIKKIIFTRIFDDTWFGKLREDELKESLDKYILENKINYKVLHGSAKEDSSNGVDFIIKNESDEIIAGIQVKPISFFNLDETNFDRIKFEKQQEKFYNTNQVPLMVYTYTKKEEKENLEENESYLNILRRIQYYKKGEIRKDV